MSFPEPSFRTQTWSIQGQDVRVKLTERPGINIYTGLEKAGEDDTWVAVYNSSKGHGDRMAAAEERVLALLEGEWRRYFPKAENPGQPTLEEILRRPYARTFLRNDNGVFTALILEFPGCITEATYIERAYEALEEAATSWVLSMQANGNPIPLPFESDTTSIANLQRLWAAVDKWQRDFPVGSSEELAREVLKIVTPRKL